MSAPDTVRAARVALPLGVPTSMLRWLGWSVAALLIAAALLPLLVKLAPARMALALEVSGDFRRLQPEAVREVMAGSLNSDFYQLDLLALKSSVERLPWVAQARVERAWPGTVRVVVEEHRAYARWGEASLLSEEGEVFTPPAATLPDGLPRLSGPPGLQQRVRETYEALSTQLARTPFVPAQLDLSARGEWTALTADGIELRLGRGPGPEAPLNAVAILAGPVTQALQGRLQEVAYVDLHYINGFAVGWRDGSTGGATDRAGSGAEVRRE